MSWSEATVLVTGLLLLLLWLVWVWASRLDRLHRKVAGSRSVLDVQLVRRASAAAELAASGLLDPVSSVLVGEAAREALAVGAAADGGLPGSGADGGAQDRADPALAPAAARARLRTDAVDRELVESDLSRTVRTALADPDETADLLEDPLGAELVADLAGAWYRVQLSRRFHNEAVAQTHRVRRKLLVRVLRLAGHAPTPRSVEIDDDWPDGLPAGPATGRPGGAPEQPV